MRWVVDNSILFSLMNPDSTGSYVFSALRGEFVAPEYIKSELNRHKSECLVKSKLSLHEFEIRRDEIERRIRFIRLSEFKKFLKRSVDSLPDQEDSQYLALALATESSVWSNDPHFKQQSLVNVFTTQELVGRLLRGEI